MACFDEAAVAPLVAGAWVVAPRLDLHHLKTTRFNSQVSGFNNQGEAFAVKESAALMATQTASSLGRNLNARHLNRNWLVLTNEFVGDPFTFQH